MYGASTRLEKVINIDGGEADIKEDEGLKNLLVESQWLGDLREEEKNLHHIYGKRHEPGFVAGSRFLVGNSLGRRLTQYDHCQTRNFPNKIQWTRLIAYSHIDEWRGYANVFHFS